MATVYVGMGALLALRDPFGFGKTMSIVTGVLMMLYGLSRVLRLRRSSN